ncbi:unnamed protein product [Pieris brassicae]|uniref:Uncharacterized protein n=1 Tax=Pieris brassicae TaxID=7116 RepID=A0A9P0XCM5_PIEBR|nr:unnamed protein product [Pieris brassicae]
MLIRFYELRNEIAEFMKIKDKPLSELSDPKWIRSLAFLFDLISSNYACGSHGCCGNSYHFNTLSAYENVAYTQYAGGLKLLSDQFSNRFSDFKNMEDCFSLFATTKCTKCSNTLTKELIEIQENSLLKFKLEDV